MGNYSNGLKELVFLSLKRKDFYIVFALDALDLLMPPVRLGRVQVIHKALQDP